MFLTGASSETTWAYTYDDAGRILICEETDSNYGTTVYTYTYDANGNRVMAVRP